MDLLTDVTSTAAIIMIPVYVGIYCGRSHLASAWTLLAGLSGIFLALNIIELVADLYAGKIGWACLDALLIGLWTYGLIRDSGNAGLFTGKASA